MDNKFLLQDLVDKLSEAGNCKKKEAEDFLRTYFKVIEDGLLQDKIVKINGLGTFKLIEVEARNSVDVNTGQAFQIKGHLKLNFIPDPQFKEKVNKPFAAFEP
ncbi:MAG: HU family DNA-binding protein, partial [Bacteroidota bacterium]|nr:HU family DNA-binding protein [Bacteroidota bacterium]